MMDDLQVDYVAVGQANGLDVDRDDAAAKTGRSFSMVMR